MFGISPAHLKGRLPKRIAITPYDVNEMLSSVQWGQHHCDACISDKHSKAASHGSWRFGFSKFFEKINGSLLRWEFDNVITDRRVLHIFDIAGFNVKNFPTQATA